MNPRPPNPGREPKADANNPQLTASEHLALAAKAMTEEERKELLGRIRKVLPLSWWADASTVLTALLGPAVQEEGR